MRLVISVLTTFVLASSICATAQAQGVYFSTRQVLGEFFKSSERVSYKKLNTRDHAAKLESHLGYVPKRDSYVVFVAYTGDRIDGYAVVDDEQGQHQPITFVTHLSAAGRVQRTEVMVYREGYGQEIRESRFRRQFVGKGIDNPIRLNKDIDAISGATISCRSMTAAVRRAVALVEVIRDVPNSELARVTTKQKTGSLR